MTHKNLRENNWKVVHKGKYGSTLTWLHDGIFDDVKSVEDTISKTYNCPRGHTFKTNNPIIIAVDGDAEYNSGPICGYCYVDWFRVNLNASEERME